MQHCIVYRLQRYKNIYELPNIYLIFSYFFINTSFYLLKKPKNPLRKGNTPVQIAMDSWSQCVQTDNQKV